MPHVRRDYRRVLATVVALVLSIPAVVAAQDDVEPPPDPSTVWLSDGFDTANLGTAGWTAVSDTARGLATIENSTLLLRASGDRAADTWRRHDALHLTRPAPDTNFVMRATFGSTPRVPYEAQGIAFVNSPFDFLRIDVIGDLQVDGEGLTGNHRLYAASSTQGVPIVHASEPIDVTVPFDLQIRRDGDLWTVFVVDADLEGVLAASFVHPIVIREFGPFATSRETRGEARFIDIDMVTGGAGSIVPMAVDEIRPLLQGEVADNTDEGVAIAWTTDEPTEGLVRITGLDGSTAELASPRTHDHRVVFTDAETNEPYEIEIVATDPSENESTATISNHIYAPPEVPIIEIYGGRDREFGFLGDPQPTLSITGIVRSPTGNFEIFWKLDDGDFELLQPDPASTRVIDAGEFSIELDPDLIGDNTSPSTLIIEAHEADREELIETEDGEMVTEVVAGEVNMIELSLKKFANTSTTGPDATITWASDDLDRSGQIANGGWHLVPGGVAPLEAGPQRILLIGDQSWSNYEVELSFVPGDVVPAGESEPVLPWAGLHLGWRGFDPVSTASNDILPTAGGVGFGQGDGGVTVAGIRNESEFIANTGEIALEPGTRYRLRARAETVRRGAEVRMKMWIDGEPEPDDWTVEHLNVGAPNGGSVALVAHRWDIVFENVTVRPL